MFSGIAILASGALVSATLWYLARSLPENTAIPEPYDDAEIRQILDQMGQRIVETRAAVAEGIERVDRTERRIKATVRRALSESEDGGTAALEAEARELFAGDGAGGGNSGVQLMPESLAEDPPSSIPGVPASYLARVRGA